MKSYLMLCKKKVKNGNQEFMVTFGYRQTLNEETGEYQDVLTSINDNGSQKFVAKSVKVALAKELATKLDNEDKYPYRLVLDTDLKLEDGRDSFYVAINKDKDGNERLDKNGKHHAIIIIRAVSSYEPVPPKSLSLDDIDNI